MQSLPACEEQEVYRMESAHVEEVEDGGELAASHMPHRLHRGSSAGVAGTSSTSSLSISLGITGRRFGGAGAGAGAGAGEEYWGGGRVPKSDFSFEYGTTGLGYRDTHIGDAVDGSSQIFAHRRIFLPEKSNLESRYCGGSR
jgi:hypothetical protein